MAEKRDFNKILEFLEDEHRHDLAVHLYLAYLLHRVNPSFPQSKWASWPMASSKVPEVPDIYEDTLEDQKSLLPTSHVSAEPLDEQLAMSFKRSLLGITVEKKRLRDLPNAVLLNAINDIVEQKIKQKLASKGLSPNPNFNRSLNRALSLKIADRASRTLWRLERRNSYRNKKTLLNTWQDVQIANMLGRSKQDRAPVASYRRSYEQARALFMERRKHYQYDESLYGSDAESDSDTDPNFVMTAPEFDIEHHLDAIKQEGTMRFSTNTDPSAELNVHKRAFEEKESIFAAFWNEAAAASQLSYASDNSNSYKIHGGPLAKEREDTLATNSLSKRDYRIHFTK